jgi:hypothetical protein
VTLVSPDLWGWQRRATLKPKQRRPAASVTSWALIRAALRLRLIGFRRSKLATSLRRWTVLAPFLGAQLVRS